MDEEGAEAVQSGTPKAYVLRLYVAGQTRKSLAAFANLKKICEEHLQGRYRIEVIDLLEKPQLAKGDQILAIPTLVTGVMLVVLFGPQQAPAYAPLLLRYCPTPQPALAFTQSSACRRPPPPPPSHPSIPPSFHLSSSRPTPRDIKRALLNEFTLTHAGRPERKILSRAPKSHTNVR